MRLYYVDKNFCEKNVAKFANSRRRNRTKQKKTTQKKYNKRLDPEEEEEEEGLYLRIQTPKRVQNNEAKGEYGVSIELQRKNWW